MLKYLSKMAMDILPSVVATILGAYIVNHYISNKPDARAGRRRGSRRRPPRTAGSGARGCREPPRRGVHAKGISEKSVFEKPITAKPVEKPQEKPEEKAAEKTPERSEDKPAETASIPADQKRPQAPAREKEKTAIRNIPLTASPAVQPATATAPSSVPANPPATIEAAVTPEERRDANANDLARAAIERLRGRRDSPEAARTPEALRTAPASQPAGFGSRSSVAAADHGVDAAGRAARPGLACAAASTRTRPAMMTPAVRRRRPIFQARARSTCRPVPRRSIRRLRGSDNTPMSPRTCCGRRSRCSTRSCRNSRITPAVACDHLGS